MANPRMKQLNINPAVTFPSIRGLLWDACLIFLSFPPWVLWNICPRIPCCRSRLISLRRQVTLCHSSALNRESNLQPKSSIIEREYLCWLLGSVTCATPGSNWSIGSSIWTWGRTSSLWGWRSTGTGWPGRLWSLLLWRYSRPTWTRSCAACSGWQGDWTGWPTEVPSNPYHSVILWFCGICGEVAS